MADPEVAGVVADLYGTTAITDRLFHHLVSKVVPTDARTDQQGSASVSSAVLQRWLYNTEPFLLRPQGGSAQGAGRRHVQAVQGGQDVG